MSGTIIFTGANGSLAIPAVRYLCTKYPNYTLILTCRDASGEDNNTKKLRDTLEPLNGSTVIFRELDLSDLGAVTKFANTTATEISAGKLPPIASIVCNAYFWNLKDPAEFTKDGYEKTFQVSYIGHVALVLRLLGSFQVTSGRIVLFSSDAHWPGKNGFEKYPPTIPDDLDLLVKPAADQPADNFGRGFQRYATSKLALVTWMYALNRALEKVNVDDFLSPLKDSAITIDRILN